MDTKEAIRQLNGSCEATRTLYLFMLGIIPSLTEEAAGRIEAARSKFNPTREDLNPNMKFVGNRIAPLISGDPDFQKIFSQRKLSWEQHDALIRSVYDSISSKNYFKDYMNSGKSSLKEDAALFTKIFEEEFTEREDLADILEDMSIWWTDELAYALTWCCHTMNDFGRGRNWTLPPLYQSDLLKEKDPGVQSDKDFVTKLLSRAVSAYPRYRDMIAGSVSQFDKDRLYVTDIALISLGLAEVANFPEIPVRASINEYVEISKFYCTPASRSFVNGLLDSLIHKMVEDGELDRSI